MWARARARGAHECGGRQQPAGRPPPPQSARSNLHARTTHRCHTAQQLAARMAHPYSPTAPDDDLSQLDEELAEVGLLHIDTDPDEWSGHEQPPEPWMWSHDDGSEQKLRELFVMIDRFGTPDATVVEPVGHGADNHSSGSISSSELMHMLLNLGEDASETLADEMVDLIDKNGSTEIEFAEFYAVLTGRVPLDGSAAAPVRTLGSGGRSIREIRKKFDNIDEDCGGTLDAKEVSKLAEKMGQGLKRRHLVGAMKAMDPTNSGEVTFHMFKNWHIDSKEGRHWSDFLVLPEGAVAALQQKAKDDQLLPPIGGAAQEWRRLSVSATSFPRSTVTKALGGEAGHAGGRNH
jgi:Ca2+-binding EF-hand superfamily protein